IERARNATVFIQTEWGASGSGFFVDAGCRVITNRHVVEFNEDKVRDEVVTSSDVQSAFVVKKQQLLAEIQRLRIEFQQAQQSDASSADMLKIRGELDQRGAEFDGLADSFRTEIDSKIHDDAWKYKFAHLKVSLVDGSEYSVANVHISEQFDLAEFSIDGNDCPFLVTGKPDDLAQGSPLFTIGNPSGLTYTVTSGVFSGFREDGDRTYLQTDAPINPGNSGGPLIDPQGRVVGINTMVLKDAQNIGFSIPVSAIDQAF
ncbi:MAG: trypsin-like peptidase domain-containing protein, partial [Dokdonella sp.]